MKTFYAAINVRGNETSIGFSNTWGVLEFTSKAERDEFVEITKERNISVRAIKATEVKKYSDVNMDDVFDN
jgi:hypothetical protein